MSLRRLIAQRSCTFTNSSRLCQSVMCGASTRMFSADTTKAPSSSSGITHVDEKSNLPMMVDITSKAVTIRMAHARARIAIPSHVMPLLEVQPSPLEAASRLGHGVEIRGKKGPVFATAIIAGTMAAKRTADLIPFCHPIPLEDCSIKIQFEDKNDNKDKDNTHTSSSGDEGVDYIVIDCIARTCGKTGVEMEAMVGASNAALTVYDMLKAVSHDICIENIMLVEKTGGKSHFKR